MQQDTSKTTRVYDSAKKSEAYNMLRAGVPVADVARRTGIGYRTLYRMRGRTPSSEELIARVRQLEDDIKQTKRQAAIDAAAAREKHRRVYERERRKDQALRSARKGSDWLRRALRLAYGVYDVLPESVWIALFAGRVIEARFGVDAMISADDRETLLSLDEDFGEDLRAAFSVRDGIESDEDVDLLDDDQLRARFTRQYRIEVGESQESSA